MSPQRRHNVCCEAAAAAVFEECLGAAVAAPVAHMPETILTDDCLSRAVPRPLVLHLFLWYWLFHPPRLPSIGEEINRLDKPGAFYGYPYCWSEGILPAPRKSVTGRQHAWLPFTAPARPGKPRKKFRGTPITNAFCRNPSRVVPPAACLPAHWAPLGMAFQPPPPPAGAAGAAARRRRRYEFPASGSGDAIVLSHGSFSRDPAVGYSVARVRYVGGAPVTGGRGASGVAVIPKVLFGSATAAAGNVTFPNGFRPLDGLFWTDGSFAFTGDKTGEIVLLRYYW